MADEVAWLREAQRQEAGAFDRLVEPYMARAYRVACGITHDREAAADALQEALLRAYRSLRNVREGQAFYPWFVRIVVNEALRQAGRRVAAPVGDLPDGPADGSPEYSLLDQELRQQVWQAIRLLPPAQRAVIVLRYYEDLSEVEMARVLAVRTGTVKSRLHYARQALERRLVDPEPAPAPWWHLTRLLKGGSSHD